MYTFDSTNTDSYSYMTCWTCPLIFGQLLTIKLHLALIKDFNKAETFTNQIIQKKQKVNRSWERHLG